MSQGYVIKQMVNAIACTIELWMHLGGLLSTQEARVALGYRLMRLLRFFGIYFMGECHKCTEYSTSCKLH